MTMTRTSGVYVDRSTIRHAGLGLFASRHFAPGETIVNYTGELLTYTQLCERYYGCNAVARYAIRVHADVDLYIDATDSFSSDARYVNDASVQCGKDGSIRCDEKRGEAMNNNAEFVAIDDTVVVVSALRHIEPGAEILASYGNQYWTTST